MFGHGSDEFGLREASGCGEQDFGPTELKRIIGTDFGTELGALVGFSRNACQQDIFYGLQERHQEQQPGSADSRANQLARCLEFFARK